MKAMFLMPSNNFTALVDADWGLGLIYLTCFWPDKYLPCPLQPSVSVQETIDDIFVVISYKENERKKENAYKQ